MLQDLRNVYKFNYKLLIVKLQLNQAVLKYHYVILKCNQQNRADCIVVDVAVV